MFVLIKPRGLIDIDERNVILEVSYTRLGRTFAKRGCRSHVSLEAELFFCLFAYPKTLKKKFKIFPNFTKCYAMQTLKKQLSKCDENTKSHLCFKK